MFDALLNISMFFFFYRRKVGDQMRRNSANNKRSSSLMPSRNNSFMESLGSDSRLSTPTSSKMDAGDGASTPKSDIFEHDKKLFQQSLPGSVLDLKTN